MSEIYVIFRRVIVLNNCGHAEMKPKIQVAIIKRTDRLSPLNALKENG